MQAARFTLFRRIASALSMLLALALAHAALTAGGGVLVLRVDGPIGPATAIVNKLFLATLKGELVVVRATPKGYDELGRAAVAGPMRQAPALADGRLFLRDDMEIVCLDVRKP